MNNISPSRHRLSALAAIGTIHTLYKAKEDCPIQPLFTAGALEKPVPDSQAAKSGLAVGDQIVEVDGLSVGGRRAKDMEPLVRKLVGEPVRLRLKRPGGAYDGVDLVAVPTPRDP